MRVFVSRPFRRFADVSSIANRSLCNAVREIACGLHHANLGGGVYKQRVAREGSGKSSGFRTIVFFRAEEVAFFIAGFAKSKQGNLAGDEVAALKELSRRMLSYDDQAIGKALHSGALEEIDCNEALS